MNILQEATIALLSGLTTKNEDGSINWKINNDDIKIYSLDSENMTYRITHNGTQLWYLNGQLHRENGPAVVWVDGSQSWFLDGKQHRKDGPAFIGANGTGIQYWYINSVQYTEEEWRKKLNK